MAAITAGSVTAAGIGIPMLMGEKEAVFDPNDSYWAKEQPAANPPLQQDVQVDVAIIGGGYTGLSTAWHMAKTNPGLNIILLEARQVGHGASGRHGGMVLPQTGLETLEIAEDEETHKWTYDLTVDSMKSLKRLVDSTGIDCELKLDGYCYTILDEEDISDDQAYVEQVQKLGMPLEFWDEDRTADELGTEYYYGAIYDPNGGRVHAMKLVKALKYAAEQEGVRIFENSQVTDIEEGQEIRLTVGNHTVRAKAIVIATNGYTSKLGYFKCQVIPVHAQCAVTPRLSEKQLVRMGWESGLPFFDSRNFLYHLVLTADNRIVIGGGSAEYLFRNDLHYSGDLNKIGAMMLDELVRIYPTLEGIQFEQVWGGILGMSYDGVDSVGVTGKFKNIYYGLAYSGHGVNSSFMFGNIISSMYNGMSHGWEKTAYANHKLSFIPPEPFKWFGVQGVMKYYQWLDQR
jgi:glycine/D-amino acid oxidase-like deaminating enzyme